jgi:site-specific recombinase XerD
MYYNEVLKKWAKAAGINKNLSSHVARNTFATLALTNGVDLYTVSKLLGHRDIAATQIYAKIIDKKKEEAVDMLPPLHLQANFG